MHILVTNDDGVFAPGIFALQQALRRIKDAKITIMAPQENQSAVGHRKTLRDPLRIRQFTLNDGSVAHACSGSPADAVALALMGYIKEPVDIVVSGINQGANMGQDITYSGTVTAAMESVLFGVPAVAISLDSHSEPAFEQAAAFAARLAPYVLQKSLPPMTLLNVNVPIGVPKGIKVTRQGHRLYHDELVERLDPSGRPYYWIGGEAPTGDISEEGTDLWAVANDYISISPIHLDLTAYEFLAKLSNWEIALS